MSTSASRTSPTRTRSSASAARSFTPQRSSSAPVACLAGLTFPASTWQALTATRWALSSAPPSMLVIGAGATGVQLASIFNAFGSRVTLFEAAPRILMTEDEDVATEISEALARSGIQVLENAGTIDRLERGPAGVRLTYSHDDTPHHIDTAITVVAAGWVANTAGLNLDAAGVKTDPRGYVGVDAELRTNAPHIFAAGDATGHVMVVHEAIREGYLAATNAVIGATTALPADVSPIGSFTDPEYASVGLTETVARETREVLVATQRFDSLARPIIDGRPTGFCKLIIDRQLHTLLGCHIVGERAGELAQLAAIAMAAHMTVEQLALVPFSFPTYANALGRAAITALRELDAHAGSASDRLIYPADATFAS